MPTLFAWLGNSDLRASEDASGTDFGPILMALETGVYDRLGRVENQRELITPAAR